MAGRSKQLSRFVVKSQPATRFQIARAPLHWRMRTRRQLLVLCSYLMCCVLYRFMVRGYVSRLWPGLFQVFSLTCLSHIITALRKACAFVCIAGGFVRTLGIGLFENDSSGQVSRPDDVDCIVASPFASKDAFPICFAMIHVMNVWFCASP